MIPNHLSCSNLCRPGKRNFLFEPGRFYKTFSLLLHVASSAVHHKSHAVDQTYLYRNPVPQLKSGCLLWNKLWLCSHNGHSGCALRKFVSGSCTMMLILYLRQNHPFHKPFDKCRLSCPHRPNHSQIQFAACPRLHIFINIILIHEDTPSLY